MTAAAEWLRTLEALQEADLRGTAIPIPDSLSVIVQDLPVLLIKAAAAVAAEGKPWSQEPAHLQAEIPDFVRIIPARQKRSPT